MHKTCNGFATIPLLIVALVLIGVGSSILFKNDDAPIEEIAEMVFEKELGLPANSVDFTPNSPEQK